MTVVSMRKNRSGAIPLATITSRLHPLSFLVRLSRWLLEHLSRVFPFSGCDRLPNGIRRHIHGRDLGFAVISHLNSSRLVLQGIPNSRTGKRPLEVLIGNEQLVVAGSQKPKLRLAS